MSQLKAEGIGIVRGRLLLGTAEKIPPQELIDTTGAGDAFIGATLYGTYLVNCEWFLYINSLLSAKELSSDR